MVGYGQKSQTFSLKGHFTHKVGRAKGILITYGLLSIKDVMIFVVGYLRLSYYYGFRIKTLRIGCFPLRFQIIAIEVNRESYEIGLPVLKRAGVERKIDFIESEGLPVLDQLLMHKENEGSFDYAYVDADKVNNWSYHERLMKLIKVGGVVIYDDTLWGGWVQCLKSRVQSFRPNTCCRSSYPNFSCLLRRWDHGLQAYLPYFFLLQHLPV
ncbi:hypothetical protein Ddye_020650 [Dipteronia dyeriana]|uniref:Caffeoyl-CoA O-methyltransferase n=1 Tax=Dipteronia dyeriana TaxID=168575 RepID=A0AAD9U047_9ROSI|nr:hypothetical protein Ddye_020650 [Dipteronia dyeriana]